MDTLFDLTAVVEPTDRPENKIVLGQVEDLLGRLTRTAKVGSPQKAGLEALQSLLQPLLKPQRHPTAPKAPTPSTVILEELQARFETQVSEAADVISRLPILHDRYAAAFAELKGKAQRELEVDLAWNAHGHDHPVHAAE